MRIHHAFGDIRRNFKTGCNLFDRSGTESKYQLIFTYHSKFLARHIFNEPRIILQAIDCSAQPQIIPGQYAVLGNQLLMSAAKAPELHQSIVTEQDHTHKTEHGHRDY